MRVEKRAVVGHEEHARRDSRADSPRASGSRRCRDGWSARRAAADPAPTPAPGRAARAGASRRTARCIRRSAGSASRDTISSTLCSSRQPSRSSSCVLQLAEPLEIVGIVRLRPRDGGVVIVGDQAPRSPRPGRDLVEHRAVAGDRHVLSSRETRSPGSRQIVPASGGLSPDNDAQQAALSRPVAADQGDALAARRSAESASSKSGQMTERECRRAAGQEGA